MVGRPKASSHMTDCASRFWRACDSAGALLSEPFGKQLFGDVGSKVALSAEQTSVRTAANVWFSPMVTKYAWRSIDHIALPSLFAFGPNLTFVLSAANGCFELLMTDAPNCTDGSKGREADLRCGVHQGPLCGTKLPLLSF